MVFTNKDFCDLIERRAQRFGIDDLEMLVCELPSEKEKLLQQILDKASLEQRAAE
jgi:hypothetical protein